MFFVLGTDHLGRDILSRLIWGGQRVLFYATRGNPLPLMWSAFILGLYRRLLPQLGG